MDILCSVSGFVVCKSAALHLGQPGYHFEACLQACSHGVWSALYVWASSTTSIPNSSSPKIPGEPSVCSFKVASPPCWQECNSLRACELQLLTL